MTWTLKIKATRPDTDTDFYTAKDSTQRLTDSDLAYVYTTYKETGKLVSGPDGTLSADELELTKTYVFRDEACKDEFQSDSKMSAWLNAAKTYNSANGIEYTTLQDEAT